MSEPFGHFLSLPQSGTIEERIEQLQKSVLTFYAQYGQDYPWRHDVSPYGVMVSEFMLQQTQTYRVEPKYIAFMDSFPTVDSLAQAPLEKVLASWQGLGYNRRGRFLHDSSKIICDKWEGELPNDTEKLQSLPGIGHPTASAIRAYAFNEPVVYIETNIRSVFIYHFFKDAQEVHDRDLLPLIEGALDRSSPRRWYSALMDYGVMLKKHSPNPGRKSRHYVKQSKFEGSRRQLRGIIIRELVSGKTGTVEIFSELSGRSCEEVESVLSDLIEERMVSESRQVYSIRNNA